MRMIDVKCSGPSSRAAYARMIAGAVLFAFGITAAVSDVQAAAPGSEGSAPIKPQPSEIALADPGSFAFAIGDRLKITFFEQYASNAATQPTGTPVLPTLIERSEMTGEYVVEQDGNIILPLLGAVGANGETQEQLRKTIERRFKETFGGSVQVSLQVIEREPIYVMGDVAQPGTFKYVPGMTVLHAMVLAGGGKNMANADDRWKNLDLSREKERLQKSEEKLKTLFARTAVLIAEREGRVPTAPQRLIDLVGPTRAAELISQAATLRDLERQKLKGESEASDDVIAALEKERALLQENLAQNDAVVKQNAKRVETLESLSKRGLTTDPIVHAARGEWSQALEHWEEVRVAIARVEHNLTEVRREKIRAAMTAEVDGAKEIDEASKAIADEEVTLSTIGRLLPGFEVSQAALTSLPGGATFKIMRRTASGLRELPSDELSALEPGDLLQVLVPKEIRGASL